MKKARRKVISLILAMTTIGISSVLITWEIQDGRTGWAIFWGFWIVYHIISTYLNAKSLISLGKLLDKHLDIVNDIESNPLATDVVKAQMHRLTNVSMLVMDRGNDQQRSEMKDMIENEIRKAS